MLAMEPTALAGSDIGLRYPVQAAAGWYWNMPSRRSAAAGVEPGRMPGHAGGFGGRALTVIQTARHRPLRRRADWYRTVIARSVAKAWVDYVRS